MLLKGFSTGVALLVVLSGSVLARAQESTGGADDPLVSFSENIVIRFDPTLIGLDASLAGRVLTRERVRSVADEVLGVEHGASLTVALSDRLDGRQGAPPPQPPGVLVGSLVFRLPESQMDKRDELAQATVEQLRRALNHLLLSDPKEALHRELAQVDGMLLQYRDAVTEKAEVQQARADLQSRLAALTMREIECDTDQVIAEARYEALNAFLRELESQIEETQAKLEQSREEHHQLESQKRQIRERSARSQPLTDEEERALADTERALASTALELDRVSEQLDSARSRFEMFTDEMAQASLEIQATRHEARLVGRWVEEVRAEIAELGEPGSVSNVIVSRLEERRADIMLQLELMREVSVQTWQ